MIESDSRPSIKIQKELLATVGLSKISKCGPIFCDKARAVRATRAELVKRSRLFEMAQPGDIIYIHDAACLAYRRQDLAKLVTEATRRGLVIHEITTGRVFSDPVDPVLLVDFCADILAVMKRESMRRYRKNNPKGRGPKLSDEQLREAKKLWFKSDLTNDEVAKKFSVTKQTLWRRFGARD